MRWCPGVNVKKWSMEDESGLRSVLSVGLFCLYRIFIGLLARDAADVAGHLKTFMFASYTDWVTRAAAHSRRFTIIPRITQFDIDAERQGCPQDVKSQDRDETESFYHPRFQTLKTETRPRRSTCKTETKRRRSKKGLETASRPRRARPRLHSWYAPHLNKILRVLSISYLQAPLGSVPGPYSHPSTLQPTSSCISLTMISVMATSST